MTRVKQSDADEGTLAFFCFLISCGIINFVPGIHFLFFIPITIIVCGLLQQTQWGLLIAILSVNVLLGLTVFT